MRPTYAPRGSRAFNRRLHGEIQAIAGDVRRALGGNLVALLLGGGYGRGEGAVVRVDGEERPYNDLDLFVVVRQGWQLPPGQLRPVAEAHTRRLGVDVDFSRPVRPEDLERLPPHLRWQDLLNGHVVIDGPEDILTARAPARLREPLPPIEGTRLLLNRGAGLLWALRVARGEADSPDPDFVRRNFQKCRLALGDAVLIAHRRFQSRCAGRDTALEALAAAVPQVAQLDLMPTYRQALAFKLDPGREADGALAADPQKALIDLTQGWAQSFLHVESHRTGRSWPSLGAYASWTGLREPGKHRPARWGRNLLLNGKLRRLDLRYPREEVYRGLPRLLSEAANPPPDWAARAEALLRVWRWVN